MVPKPFFLVGVSFVLLATACGEDQLGEPAPTTVATATTTTTEMTTTTSPTPVDIAVEFFEVMMVEHDPVAWREMFGHNAWFKDGRGHVMGLWMGNPYQARDESDPGSYRPQDYDFDGDGSLSTGDWWSWLVAFHGLIDHELVSLQCVPTGGEVACTLQETDAIGRLAGVEPEPYVAILTIEDELVVGWEEPGFDPTETDEAGEAWVQKFLEYEEWVSDLHPDLYPKLFRGGRYSGDFLSTPETIPIHAELIPEWLAGISKSGA